MRREQRQNEILLDTVKRIQSSSAGSLYENEITLLRTVIEQKQGYINKLHAEGLELSQKIEEWQLRLRDEEDRSKEERDQVLQASQVVEAAIEEISQDTQLAVQRLGQYEMLYTRTVEDKNDAESKMLRARELVSMGREDLSALGECLLQTKAAQEKQERELSGALARLESSRLMWKSSLDQRTKEIDGIIRRYEEAKNDRIREEEASALQRLEADRVRQEMEARERERVEKQMKESERMDAVDAEQWRVVCVAAGVTEGSSAGQVIAAYEACRCPATRPRRIKHINDTRKGESNGTCRVGRGGTGALGSSDWAGDTARSHLKEQEAASTQTAFVQHGITPSMATRAEMSIRMIRRKVASHLGQDEAADNDSLAEQLRQLSQTQAASRARSDIGSLYISFNEIQFAEDPWEAAAAAVEASNIEELDRFGTLVCPAGGGAPPSMVSSTADRKGPVANGDDSEQETTKEVLNRHEMKVRSRKMHAKLNKVAVY